MRTRLHAIGLLLGISVTASACTAEATGPGGDPSYFRATISGALSTTYQGTGRFTTGSDPRRPAAPAMFSLFSAGTGTSENQTFQLFRSGAGLPAPGKHPLGLGASEFGAQFSRTGNRGETLEGFSASSGELELTVSTPQRIEGSFRMVGFRTCHRTPNGSGVMCVVPTVPDPNAPTIEVSGTFVAVPFAPGPAAWR